MFQPCLHASADSSRFSAPCAASANRARPLVLEVTLPPLSSQRKTKSSEQLSLR